MALCLRVLGADFRQPAHAASSFWNGHESCSANRLDYCSKRALPVESRNLHVIQLHIDVSAPQDTGLRKHLVSSFRSIIPGDFQPGCPPS